MQASVELSDREGDKFVVRDEGSMSVEVRNTQLVGAIQSFMMVVIRIWSEGAERVPLLDFPSLAFQPLLCVQLVGGAHLGPRSQIQRLGHIPRPTAAGPHLVHDVALLDTALEVGYLW